MSASEFQNRIHVGRLPKQVNGNDGFCSRTQDGFEPGRWPQAKTVERFLADGRLERLLSLVWGADVFLSDRVIYTHVNNLRGKVEADPSRPRHIVSIRGLGYRFDV